MGNKHINTDFYEELLLGLPSSTAAHRTHWTKCIVAQKIPVSDLINLATEEKPIASRFLWLLGDLAETAPELLFPTLNQLYQLRRSINGINVNRSLAKYWQLCGIPIEHEAEAIEMLFDWLNDSKSNVSLKMHAAQALYNASLIHKELRVELLAILEDQLHKNGKSFDTRTTKLITRLSERVGN